MRRILSSLFFIILVTSSFTGCDKNNNIDIFTVQDDLELGQQVKAEIASDNSYHLLDSADYPQAYDYLYSIVNNILNSGEVAYKDEFVWEVHIIQDDTTLNAFCTPGGYIYVYTGLIKYLDNVDALAGVLGHEMAHADLRHTSRNLQKAYGVSFLLNLLLGKDPGTMEKIAAQIAGKLAGLKFSREYENEADAQSVVYLAHTQYACNGVEIFFQKLEAQGQSQNIPEFLSTHPSPDNRIENIEAKVQELGCDESPSDNSGYAGFVNSLP